MKIYDYTHKAEYFDSKILRRYLGDMRLGVFDIETLGLYPETKPDDSCRNYGSGRGRHLSGSPVVC